MNTPMQELIEFVDTLPIDNVLTERILNKAIELLEKEKAMACGMYIEG